MRERTLLSKEVLDRLPRLKLIASTASSNSSIDIVAAKEHGISIVGTRAVSTTTAELTWALILASARHIVSENRALREGRWQESVGVDLAGKTLGIIGLGKIGSAVAKVGLAFGMKVIAWSEHLSSETAEAVGCSAVSKVELLRSADIVSIHLVLSDQTRALVGKSELSLMKQSAMLINTSRGPIVVEEDLLAALDSGQIAGAALDVYDVEPLPQEHPYRSATHLLATPHIGYVTEEMYKVFYGDTVQNLESWLAEL
jgi:phosphoglycerate dehydrogenase-like enzyme